MSAFPIVGAFRSRAPIVPIDDQFAAPSAPDDWVAVAKPLPSRRLTPIHLDRPNSANSDMSLSVNRGSSVAHFLFHWVFKPLVYVMCLPFKLVFGIPNYFSMRKVKQLFESAKIAVLKTALDLPLSYGTQAKVFSAWNEQELYNILNSQYITNIPSVEKTKNVQELVSEVKEIAKAIKNGKNSQNIRKMISEVMKSDVYQNLKTLSNPCVDFLQILCMKFMGGKVEGAPDPFVQYGKQELGDLTGRETFTLDEMATLMDSKLIGTWDFQRNGPLSTVCWGVTHPVEFVHSKEASWFPLEFNSHEGNPTTYGYDFTLPQNPEGLPANAHEKRIRFYYGPGPTGDLLFNEGYLVYMDKLRNNGIRISERRVNNQNIHEKSEAARIHEMRRFENEYPNSLRFMSLSFDTPWMKHPPAFSDAAGFCGMLERHYTQNGEHRAMYQEKAQNGVYIGRNVINDRQVTGALRTAGALFQDISQGNEFWNKCMAEGQKGEDRLGRMMILGSHAVLGVGSIYRALQETSSEEEIRQKFDAQLDKDLILSRASGACKQDIDRAIVENVAERVFFRIMKDPSPLTKEELYSIVGAVLSRAFQVEGRQIQLKRYTILSDLLHFIGSQENMQKLSTHLRNYINASFTPSMTATSALAAPFLPPPFITHPRLPESTLPPAIAVPESTPTSWGQRAKVIAGAAVLCGLAKLLSSAF